MKATTLIGYFVLAGALAGCASAKVNTDWDRDARFADFHTYAWAETPDMEVMQHATLFDRRLRSAVDDHLAAKGFRKADADGEPDLLLVYQAGVQEKVDVRRWGYAGRQWDARQYHEGGLVIDLVDAKQMSLVWRGTATAEVSSPDRSGDRIAEVVKKMFADFPAG